MKKLRFVCFMCLMGLLACMLSGCDKDDNYVDLGLPSGTKWKSVNEIGGNMGLYTYDKAVKKFGDKLPSIDQWLELLHYCHCEKSKGRVKFIGLNGNTIVLPVSIKVRDCDGNVDEIRGAYWSSTPCIDSEYAAALVFGAWNGHCQPRCCKYSVRLIKNQ